MSILFVFSVIIYSLTFFASIRAFMSEIKSYQLNKSAYKKRKKGETLREWIFQTRFKDVLPKSILVLYYIVIISHIVFISLVILNVSVQFPFAIVQKVGMSVMAFDVLWWLTIKLLFWTPKGRTPYERWIPKKRGQPRKKKK